MTRFAPGLALVAGLALLFSAGCGFFDSTSEASGDADRQPGASREGGQGRRGGEGGRPGGGSPGGAPSAGSAIPVRTIEAARRTIAEYFETNGSIEAEQEVDLIARTAGPIVELLVEEGMRVGKDQLLARIDDKEVRTQLEVSKVALEEARLAFERAKKSHAAELIPQETFDQAKSRLDSAQAQVEGTEILLGYTSIRAPFAGVIVERYIKFAEHVANGTALFRLADFDPLHCPIQVPEKELGSLRIGQPAYLTVEAFGEERFQAKVLRISPVVASATGTVKVTLEVQARGKLRPGMFASVFVEIDRHQDALVIPKGALVLESIGDTVYVMRDSVAERREVQLGFDDADSVEVLAGLEAGDDVIVLGQDSLSNGTPVYTLASPDAGAVERNGGASPPATAGASEQGTVPDASAPAAGARAGKGPPPGFDPANMTPEMLDSIRERMRSRGLSEKQIEERLERMRAGELPGRER